MSLRKTSCAACVSAKRRCDRGTPACRRCVQKTLVCEFPYPITQTRLNEPLVDCSTSSDLWNWVDNIPISEGVNETGLSDFEMAALPNLTSSPLHLAWDALNPTTPSEPHPPVQQISELEGNIEIETLESLLGPWLDQSTCIRGRSVDKARGDRQVSRHRRKQHHRNSQRIRESIPRALPAHGIWPRGHDAETWNFCAGELMSFVTSFAATASSPFILHPALRLRIQPHVQLHYSLQRALGVCAAHSTLGDQGRLVLSQLLETEVQQLIESSQSGNTLAYDPSISDTHENKSNSALFAFREALARVQAMILYQIIGLFGAVAGRQRPCKQHEALMASWTRELLLHLQVIERQPKAIPPSSWISSPSSNLDTDELDGARDHETTESLPNTLPLLGDTMPLQEEEIWSAYRTILVSYLVRSVYSALTSQTCALLAEMGSMPVLVSRQGQQKPDEANSVSRQDLWVNIRDKAEARGLLNAGRGTISYTDFVHLWNGQNWTPGLEGYDRFTVLLLVACKGVEIFTCQPN
ncbi:hypothetical protein BKA56DRAFT_574823 [Ilyonectria sp. MPI-CAGE-AT-0026]|nr:hypothetical protein BKA56DRAFT_574823 [Ilyonectria sp. MPI-CAGE-AT-0026]